MSALVLPTKFTAVDGISGPAKIMQQNLHNMANAANIGLARQERLWRRIVPSMSGAARNLLDYGKASIGFATVGASVKGITDYEDAIQSLQAVTGVSNAELVNFKKEIATTANETKRFASDVAGSFEVIGSNMSQYLGDPKALNQISKAGITLSKASRQELVPTLENLTSIMNQFNLSANKASDTVNRLTAGEIVGSLRTNQVAEALQEFGAGAYAANITLSESIALTEALAKQLKADKIGVGARNIVTVLDSAKGLDKKARKDLRNAGVDLNFLMDKSQTLGARLKELSKISGDATAITSVFGRENKTAAQVIFNQLPTYEAYLAKIKVTNEAQTQSATNSNTLMNRVKELGATWVNYISTNDKTAKGLEMVKDGIKFVTENIDGFVTVAVNAVKIMAVWKAAMVAHKVITTSLNIALGISNALKLQSIGLIEGNIVATKASVITEKAMAAAIAVSTGNWAALNTVIGLSPIGWALIGVAALTGSVYLLSKREKELREEYEKQIQLNASAEIDKQTDALKRQIAQLVLLGDKLDEATVKRIKFNKSSLDYQRFQVEQRIKQTKSEQDKMEFSSLEIALGAFGYQPERFGKRKELNERRYAQEASANKIAQEQRAIAQFAKQQIDMGNIKQKDLGNIFNSEKSTMPDWTKQSNPQSDWAKMLNPKKESGGYFEYGNDGKLDLLKMYEKITGGNKQQPVNVTIEAKGLPDWLRVSTGNSGTGITPSSTKSF
jgi:TP901 family phage tail tape measure protein